ncbi:MAG: hypothetical protein O7C68_04195, partial [Rickettsia endosymbiont of Ixodes ricinus]|nr:hypothetical protein [Rickettsia endosymbiont of Ixodes ricinus]MCZ6896785.1 hypothetical protein [Rickettsia endosymbiont of Ixodes ricinus]
KFWITSRLHYEQTLENKLSIFATKFEPLNDQKNKEFIYQFFKNRLHHMCIFLRIMDFYQ